LVYLCIHEELHSLKVGVGASKNARLAEHRRHGWVTVFTTPVLEGAALLIEKEILGWWRNDLGLPPHLSAKDMPQRGWTETVALDAVSVPDTILRIQALVATY
jgi:hypothetical protein